MNDTAIDIPGISNTNRASKLMDEMGLGKSGRSVVRQRTQSVKEEVLQKPMLAYETRFGVGSDERHTLQLDELRGADRVRGVRKGGQGAQGVGPRG